MQSKNVAEGNARLLAALIVGLVVLMAHSSPGFAQDAPQAERDVGQGAGEQGASEQGASDEKKAEAYYNKGVEAFFKKKYSLAITFFQRANALDPDPVVLYNISLAHSKMGNAKEALAAALEAQQMGDLPEDTALKNQFRIIGYRRILSARGVTEAINPPGQAEVDPNKKVLNEPDPDEPEPEDGMSALGWTGIGTAGVGLAALVGAGGMSFLVSDNLTEYDTAQADGDYERAKGLQSDIRDRQSLGRVMLYSGAGLAAVGGALFAYDFFGGAESAGSGSSTSLSGAVDADGASVQLRWTF